MRTTLVLTLISGPFKDARRAGMSRAIHWIGAGQTLTVGRSGFGTDVAVRQDPKISSVHFRISCGHGSCYVHDLNSRNGTSVNGAKVNEASLWDGDLIRVGDTTFRVQIIKEMADDSVPEWEAIGKGAGGQEKLAQRSRGVLAAELMTSQRRFAARC